MSFILKGSKAPNLPIGPIDYAQWYQDQFNNILRLYFNELDNINNALLGPHGMIYLDAPYVAAQDTTDQYADGNNDPTIVKWNTLDYGNGFTLNNDNTATAAHDGLYRIDYSLEFANTDNAQHDVIVWLKVNGTDVVGSASKFTVPSRKNVGIYGYVVGYSSVVFRLNAGDDVGLWWATAQAYNPTGPIDGVYIEHLPAQTVPYAHPSVPSAIGCITFLSR